MADGPMGETMLLAAQATRRGDIHTMTAPATTDLTRQLGRVSGPGGSPALVDVPALPVAPTARKVSADRVRAAMQDRRERGARTVPRAA
jgi:hypothetical protein